MIDKFFVLKWSLRPRAKVSSSKTEFLALWMIVCM